MTFCSSSASFADEYHTEEQAEPFVNMAFDKYGISSINEGENFSFYKNHFPPDGRPNQDNRNPMMFPFLSHHAIDTEETKDKVLKLVLDDCASQSASIGTKNAVKELVLGDRLSFASSVWFNQASGDDRKGCTSNHAVVDGLQAESVEGWSAFITEFVGL